MCRAASFQGAWEEANAGQHCPPAQAGTADDPYPFVASHSEAFRRNRLAVAYTLDERVSHDVVAVFPHKGPSDCLALGLRVLPMYVAPPLLPRHKGLQGRGGG